MESQLLILPRSHSELQTVYNRIFHCIQSQRTIFDHLLKSKNGLIDLYRSTLNNILTADCGRLFQRSFSAFEEISKYLILTEKSKEKLPPDVEKVGYTLLAALLAINKLTALLLYTNNDDSYFSDMDSANDEIECIKVSRSGSASLSSLMIIDNTSDNLQKSDNSIICRICEREVPLDHIETHSQSCALAYLSSKNMKTVEDRMRKLQVLAQQTILRVEWPNDQKTAVSTIIPVLHVIAMLDRAIDSGSSSASSSNTKEKEEELAAIHDTLFLINRNKINSNIIDQAISLVNEKRDFAVELSAALDIVKSTTNDSSTNVLYVPTEVTIADFDFIKKISSGAYARVYLTRKSQTGDLSATKAIPRTSLKQMNDVQRVLVEKNILSKVSSEFMITFFFSIIGKNNLYIVMEFCPGGDLFSVLKNVGKLNEDMAVIYTAQIVAALEFLRSNNVIHRDLKPDNILVCADGRLKLTDFGLSAFGSFDRSLLTDDDDLPSCDLIVGTPDYIAPEMILQHPHSFSADYWSLGCILIEFLTGVPPFHQETSTETFACVLKGDYDLSVLDNYSNEVKDLISKLLQTDPLKRIGANSIDEIKSHPWFKINNIDFDNLDKLKPPFIPQLDDDEDTSYFEERYQWNDECEKDILDDINDARNVQKIAKTKTSSSFFSEDNYSITDTDDDLSSFPSMSTGSLNSLTRVESLKKRKTMRASSFSEQKMWPEIPVNNTNSFLIESKSFTGIFEHVKEKKAKKRLSKCSNSQAYLPKFEHVEPDKTVKSDDA